MAPQYTCKNALRRILVLQQGILNGIDFLEVLDDEAIPLQSPPQQTLVVHFLQPNPSLSVSNFQITGGVRITPVSCVWAFPAGGLVVPPATLQEQNYFSSLADKSKIIAVRTNVAGDFSTYTLNLVNSPDDTSTPSGFDPRLSSIDFSFKVECPSDFDCASTATCPPSNLEAPPIDYLAKDYASFRQLMLDRLAVTMPEWRERNPTDIGIALVEVLAYGADHISYYQDAVATEAYLGTARKRVSVRRHSVLLDYNMHDGCNSRAWVFVDVDDTVNGQLLPGPVESEDGIPEPGTALLTQSSLPAGVVIEEQKAHALAQGALAFETVQDVILRKAHNEMHFYTWSDESCCLPAGATKATLNNQAQLSDSKLDIQLEVGDALLLEEVLSPVTGVSADADPSHKCIVRLTNVTKGSDPLDGTPVVEIAWAEADALTFPLCLSAPIVQPGGGAVPVGQISVARGNIVLADHGLTIPGELLNPAVVPANGFYRPQLQNARTTFRAPYDDAVARRQPATGATQQDPRVAIPAIALTDGVSVWLPRRDLLESDQFAREFVLETEDDGTATLRFGDGQLGALPVSGLAAFYRVGNGAAGNVGAGAITNIVAPIRGIRKVRNPLPAIGGIDPEPIDDVRHYAPQAFRTQERAVTAKDYEVIAARYPQVQKAHATLRWTGSWYTVFVTVERANGQAIDADFSQGLGAFLDTYRMSGCEIQIEPPVYVPLDIAFTVCVSAGYFRGDVEQALYRVFSNQILANGQPGFFYPGNFTFGQSVFLSQIVATAMQVAGVRWIDIDDTAPKLNHFKRWGQGPNGETAAGEIDFAAFEIARLDNDPNAPENGRIEFFMDGGL